MLKVYLHTKIKAFSLVEAILSIGLFMLIATLFTGAVFFGVQSSVVSGNRARAANLAEEGLEAVRNMRDEDFSNLSDGTYGLILTNNGGVNEWTLTGSETVDIFTRQITIATVDGNTKNIISSVAWEQTPQNAGTVTVAMNLKNWRTIFNQAGNLIIITGGITIGE